MKNSIIPLIIETIPSCKSKPGIQGHGEGLTYGKSKYGSQNLHFYYRFNGKDIPRDRVTYVTAESNYFSRATGDKEQLIVMYDSENKGFRVLAHITTPGEFKEKFALFKRLGNLNSSLEKIKEDADKSQHLRDSAQALIDSGKDLF